MIKINSEKFFGELYEAYINNDEELFYKLNDKYNLHIESFDQLELLENRPAINLSRFYDNYNAQYMINFCTSRLLPDFKKEVPKHSLNYDGLKIYSYSWVIFHVLNELELDDNLEKALDNVDLGMDREMAKMFLLSKGFIEYDSQREEILELEKEYSRYKVVELKNLLRANNLKVSGNKADLIQRLVEFNFSGNVDGDEVTITPYGYFRLNGLDWVALYKLCLSYFDFHDYEQYMTSNDTGDVFQNSFNYLDENLVLACEERSFERLHDVLAAKAALNVSGMQFGDALHDEINLFIFKICAMFLDKNKLDESYKAVEFPNINNIVELADLADIEDIKTLFNQCWDEVDFDEKLLTKDTAYDFLESALNGADIPQLSQNVVREYYM